MNDHVAVLREVLANEHGGDHHDDSCDVCRALVAIEQHAAAVAERDALVARLGELEKVWQEEGIRLNGGADKPYTSNENSVRALMLGFCADDLARVVAGNGGGDE